MEHLPPIIRPILPLVLLCILLSGCRKDEMPVESGHRNVNGVSLYYKILGDGEPIVVLHGGPGLDHSYFLPQMATLAHDFQLIFFDQRLSGRSSGEVDSSAVSMDHFVEDVEGIRIAFGLKKMNLMGHSWGGLLAMYYGIKYPANLKSLILVNPTAASMERMMASHQILMQRFTQQDLVQRTTILQSEAFKNGEPTAYVNLLRLGFGPSFYNRSLLDSLTLVLPANFAANSAKLQLLFRDMYGYDIHQELSKISCPTLIIRGDYDTVPAEAIRTIQQAVPNAELVVLEKCGHFPFVESPKMFFQQVEQFLQRVQ